MLQEAIDLQNDAINKLVDLSSLQSDITFKAPTGSGKTFMMAKMMDRIIENNPDVIFLVSALSKGGLAQQNFDKFSEYQHNGLVNNLEPYLISTEVYKEEQLYIPTDKNVYILSRDLYKKNGLLMRGPMVGFLQHMTLGGFLGKKHKKIYLIKDECHIKTNNLDTLSDEFFTKVFNISATPNLKRGQKIDVEISEVDAVNTKLIKDVTIIDDLDATIGDSLKKLQEIKTDYRNMLQVNPCLIIQISNKNKADKEIEMIMNELNTAENLNLKWMLIVNKETECDTNDTFKAKKLPVNKWKDYAKENLSTIDVIIFKMVISEGWDIPRACMLYQVRDSNSDQLNEQVLGRVRRNPRLLDYKELPDDAQKLATTSWVWGMPSVNRKKTHKVILHDQDATISKNFKIKTTRLKPITKKNHFDLKSFLKNKSETTSPSSIFDLYKKNKSVPSDLREIEKNYSDTYLKWLHFNENIGSIMDNYNDYIYDYQSSMEIVIDEDGAEFETSFPSVSHYVETEHYTNISDWVWRRSDGHDKYSFDSQAEKDWAVVLKDLSKDDSTLDGERAFKREYLGIKNPAYGTYNVFGKIEEEFIEKPKTIYMWGKNYFAESNIKFEYYLNGTHYSYPDFIMQDSYDRIHIFEVKSVNVSNSIYMDSDSYNKKTNELKKAYLHSSLLTGHIFYLPIQNGDNWTIFQYIDGKEFQITKSEFESFVKNPS